MPQAADALHRNQISAAQTGIAKGVVGGNTRAQEWGGLCGIELVRNGSDAARFGNHHFRISTIHSNSQHHGVLTIHTVPASARFTHPVFACDQADADPLTDFPPGHACPQRFNAADNFVPRNARQSQTRINAQDRGRIGVTDSTRFHSNPNLTGTRFGDWSLDNANRAWR
jgi:hypothetical protein